MPSLLRRRGHVMVQISTSTTRPAFCPGTCISATQRRFRHTPQPYTAPQRLEAPKKTYNAVQPPRFLQEIERLKGTRFSHVTVKPKAPSKYSATCLRTLGVSISGSESLAFFKQGFETKPRSLSSLFGWTPVEWSGSILYIDFANCKGSLKVRKLSKIKLRKSSNRINSALNDLVQFSQVRGCQLRVMVEGIRRDMPAPEGVQVIRAQPIKRKDIGDDAIVESVQTTLEEGVEPARIVLITDDKGLIRRMPLGVKKRSPDWLAREMENFLAEVELGSVPGPTPPAALKVKNLEAMGNVENNSNSGNALRDWWVSLRSLPTLLWSSMGPNESQRRETVTRPGSFERI